MLYDIQRVERDRNGIPGLFTDLVSSNKRRIKDRVLELRRRGQQCRIVPQYGQLVSAEEFAEF